MRHSRLFAFNHPVPATSRHIQPARIPNQQNGYLQTALIATINHRRARSTTPNKGTPPTSVNCKALCNVTSANVASTGHVHKKPKPLQGPQYHGQDSASADACNHPALEENDGTQDTTNTISVHQESFAATADLAERQAASNITLISAAADTAPLKGDNISCGDTSLLSDFVKASCQHLYCQECFQQFVEASLGSYGNFPPKCCDTFLSLQTVAENVSAPLLDRCKKRQAEIKNAIGLYCAIEKCAVRIPTENIDGFRAECALCHKFTCTQCRGSMPKKNPSTLTSAS